MSTYQSPLTVIIKGAIAGAAGTAVMSAVMERAPELIERMGVPMPEPQAPPRHPDEADAPTAEVAEGVAQEPLPPEARAKAGEAIHWGYGAAWGAFYGIMQSSLKLPHLLHGTLFGILVYGVATTLAPRLRLAPSPADQPPQLNALQLGSHLVYGWATAVTYAILNLGRRG